MHSPLDPRRPLAVLVCLVALVATGCEEASITEPEVPGGGQQLVLDFEQFEALVVQIFTQRGCDNLACHGGGIRGTFQLSPASAKDTAFDFDQSTLQVDPLERDASALLLKPLAEAAGGAPHAGDGPTTTFSSVDDPDFQTLRAWILEGELR